MATDLVFCVKAMTSPKNPIQIIGQK
jgi:hypothetical protein